MSAERVAASSRVRFEVTGQPSLLRNSGQANGADPAQAGFWSDPTRGLGGSSARPAASPAAREPGPSRPLVARARGRLRLRLRRMRPLTLVPTAGLARGVTGPG